MIFAVFDPSPLTVCINCSFFTFITDKSQIGCATADPQQTFTCQNLSRSVYAIALWRRKTPIFAVFWTSAFSAQGIRKVGREKVVTEVEGRRERGREIG